MGLHRETRVCKRFAMQSPGVSPSSPDISDIELMEQVKQGSQEAFECLIRRHQQSLLNFFRRMGVNNYAEDLVQETLLKVFGYREKYRASAKFTTFLYTIARNVWIDSVRKAGRYEAFQEELVRETENSDDGGMSRLLSKLDIQAALARLPEKLRSVAVLNVSQGLRYEEIAEVLGIPYGTVKSRMFTALNKLREMMDHA